MEFEGKTVEEAVATGLESMGLTSDDVEIEVVEEPTKGLFGKLKGKAVVKICEKKKESKSVIEFITNLFKILDVNAKAIEEETENGTVINIIAENSSEIIGKKGEVLDAIQTLCGAVSNIGSEKYKKVTVNCENYREKREETLIALAHRLENKATEMRRDVILEPMNPFERRIIHSALSESATVKTFSEGVEPNRYIVISPIDKDEFSTPYNAGKNRNGNDRRHGKKPFNKGRNFKSKSSGFTEQKKKSSFSFGTYLGNSKKDNF